MSRKPDPAAELAEALKRWREKAQLPANRAAQLLGIPRRTLEGIEQGRGFRYPRLLILALEGFA
jgi:DNA-binding XRE family transcriptional regulator